MSPGCVDMGRLGLEGLLRMRGKGKVPACKSSDDQGAGEQKSERVLARGGWRKEGRERESEGGTTRRTYGFDMGGMEGWREGRKNRGTGRDLEIF